MEATATAPVSAARFISSNSCGENAGSRSTSVASRWLCSRPPRLMRRGAPLELPHILVERLRHYFSTYKLVPGAEPQIVIQEIYGHEHAMQVVEASIADYETLLAVGEG